jgi:hypothetical protein
MKFKAVQLCALLCLSALFSWAQTGLATVAGIVTDQTGAVMAGVEVKATQLATGAVSVGVTTDTGNYALSQLRVGEYEIVVEKSGFKTYKREAISLNAAQTLRLDVQLEVGATTESVTVTAEATLLHTDSGTLTTNITPAQIRNLPLLPVGTFIRDPFSIAQTACPARAYSIVWTAKSSANSPPRPSPHELSPVRMRSKKSPCRPVLSLPSSAQPRARCLTSPSSPVRTSITAPCMTTTSTKC